MQITKSNLKSFRKDFSEAMKSLEEKYEVQVQMKGISYSDESFNFKAEVVNGGNAEDVEKIKFEGVCTQFGLKASDYKATVTVNGQPFMLVGLKPQSPKNCAVVRNERGTTYVCGRFCFKHLQDYSSMKFEVSGDV